MTDKQARTNAGLQAKVRELEDKLGKAEARADHLERMLDEAIDANEKGCAIISDSAVLYWQDEHDKQKARVDQLESVIKDNIAYFDWKIADLRENFTNKRIADLAVRLMVELRQKNFDALAREQEE